MYTTTMRTNKKSGNPKAIKSSYVKFGESVTCLDFVGCGCDGCSLEIYKDTKAYRTDPLIGDMRGAKANCPHDYLKGKLVYELKKAQPDPDTVRIVFRTPQGTTVFC